MTGIAIGMSAGWFPPVTNTYDSGSGTETIPNGASQLIAEIWGAGNIGGAGDAGIPAVGGGAGSGGYSKKTFTLTPSDWGKTFSYTVGAASGGNTTLTNGTYGTAVSMTANGGGIGQDAASGGNQGSGGTASGGDVNTTGNGSGGVTRVGAGAPNGGGNVATGIGSTPGGGGAGGSSAGGPGSAGANGRAKFAYT